MNKNLANLILLTVTFFGSWAVYANPDLTKGAKLFQMCAACHGQSGEGSQILNAPASAGQSQWYVKQQLNNFRAGIRGSHPEDSYGRQMIPMATILKDEQAVIDVSSFIETLPLTKPKTTLEADPSAGKASYGICASCHGTYGEGIAALNAPRLSHQHDWYIARQIRNFKQGIRGSHAKDFYGNQMRSMALILATDQQIDDVSAYISALD